MAPVTSGVPSTAWRDVPEAFGREWSAIFTSSKEVVDLAASCPICGQLTLHRWFYLHRARPSSLFGEAWQGEGSQWQWCSTCGCYEHSSGLVPGWWTSPWKVAVEDLLHDPGVLEAQLRSRATPEVD